MAQIIITTTPEEQQKIVDTLKTLEGKTVAVSAIARAAGIPQNRTRYIIEDLLTAERIRRIPTRQFNKQYVRYRYEVC